MENSDQQVVESFGKQWARFDQEGLSADERWGAGEEYFHIFPWEEISPSHSVGADIGCGSGRWAALLKDRVHKLSLLDASEEALSVAKHKYSDIKNFEFTVGSVGRLPYPSNSLDFAYCLGVLHHIPHPKEGLCEIARVLKPGQPFLGYLYYRFDNKPRWYAGLWQCVNFVRKIVCRLPYRLRHLIADFIAVFIYWPLARTSFLLEKIGLYSASWPLSAYRHRSFYFMRTDALDRFGTKIEKRFTKIEVEKLLDQCGFENVIFSTKTPHWTFCARKKTSPSI